MSLDFGLILFLFLRILRLSFQKFLKEYFLARMHSYNVETFA